VRTCYATQCISVCPPVILLVDVRVMEDSQLGRTARAGMLTHGVDGYAAVGEHSLVLELLVGAPGAAKVPA
jgi:hypothetical protein